MPGTLWLKREKKSKMRRPGMNMPAVMKWDERRSRRCMRKSCLPCNRSALYRTHWGWRGQQSALIKIIGFPDPTPTCHLTVVSVQIHLHFLHGNELCHGDTFIAKITSILPLFHVLLFILHHRFPSFFCYLLSLLATSSVGHPAHEVGIFKKINKYILLCWSNTMCIAWGAWVTRFKK